MPFETPTSSTQVRASKGFPRQRLGNSKQVLAGWVSTINESLSSPSPPASPAPLLPLLFKPESTPAP